MPPILPDPAGKPGNAGKPVKDDILAGQSNAVGMGNPAERFDLFSLAAIMRKAA
ncbi:MAG: hypothetical protein GWO24_22695 [Akkermansiaceae bacterium]|nr:hypothetical protein [Akkermansiaceae bacterium]